MTKNTITVGQIIDQIERETLKVAPGTKEVIATFERVGIEVSFRIASHARRYGYTVKAQPMNLDHDLFYVEVFS